MYLDFIRKERRSICWLILAFIITAVSLYADLTCPNDKYWFQRSGAWITITSVLFQFQKLVSTWSQAFENEIKNIPTRAGMEAGQGISMSAMAREGWDTRDFLKRIHDMVATKSPMDVTSFWLVLVGTIIWAYGDIPFRS